MFILSATDQQVEIAFLNFLLFVYWTPSLDIHSRKLSHKTYLLKPKNEPKKTRVLGATTKKSVFYFKYSLKPFNKHFAYIDYRMNAPFISFTH